jgi:long-chain acyl-CoA synthetase
MRDLKLANPDSTLTVPLMLEAIHNQVWLTAERAGKDRALRLLMNAAKVFRALHIPFRPKTFLSLRESICSSLRLIICGGAHLSREIAEEFELWGIQVLQGYGITECSPLISVNCNYTNKLGTVGLPMPSLEVRIDDGEVCVRGPSVMRGYYKDEDGTSEAMTKDGWFKTGDIGSMDRNGFLSLSGRKKNLIVFKNGKKISPEKLEEMICAIPMVKEVVVTGTANGIFADDVKLTASIYPDSDRTQGMSSYEILEQLQREVDEINHTLPSYQQIQLINIRTKEFDKTGTRKIKRHSADIGGNYA